MKLLPGLFASFVALAGAFSNAKAQAPAPPSGEPLNLDEVPAQLKKADDELAKKFEGVRVAVEEEAAAGHLSEAVAQSLRWSLRTASSYAVTDARNTLATARVPLDNVVLSQAFKELEVTNTTVQAKRTSLLAEAKKEVRRRTEAAVRSATKPEDIDEVKAAIERWRDVIALPSLANSSDSQNSTNCSKILALTKGVIGAEVGGDPVKLGTAMNQLRNHTQYGSEGVASSEIQERIDRVVQPFVKAVEEKQRSLDAAFEARKSSTEISAALNDYTEAVERLNQVRGGNQLGGGDTRESLQPYRTLAATIERLEAGKGDMTESDLSGTRSAVQQLRGKRSTIYQDLLTKWMKEASERSARLHQERLTGISARLSAVKAPADLGPIVADLNGWTAESHGRQGDSFQCFRDLSGALSTLAAAWSSGSFALLQQERSGEGAIARSSFANEFSFLKKRIERDVLSRVLRAPELNVAEAQDLAPDMAIENLCDDLAKRGDWRRLYELVEARTRIQNRDGVGRPNDETANALRAFFAGQNFELAEQWSDAIQSYKSVLRCASERAPIKPAADRLKVLSKEHPEAAAARPESADR